MSTYLTNAIILLAVLLALFLLWLFARRQTPPTTEEYNGLMEDLQHQSK